jgi:hypothetical protein
MTAILVVFFIVMPIIILVSIPFMFYFVSKALDRNDSPAGNWSRYWSRNGKNKNQNE